MADLNAEAMICGVCQSVIPRGIAICPRCGGNPRTVARASTAAVDIAGVPSATPGSFALILPNWDRVELPSDGVIELGRESAIEIISAALENFEDVSRHHATITVTVTGMSIMSFGEYGTWVEDQRVPDNVPMPVTAGQRIRLATKCFVKVAAADG